MMKEPKKALRELVSRLLEEGNSIRIPAEGYSMYPSIRPGDAIMITPIPDAAVLNKGEIIAWKRERDLVVHRVISVEWRDNEMLITTRGDSSPYADSPITTGMIAGRVTMVEKRGRRQIPEIKPEIAPWRYNLNHILARFASGLGRLVRSVR